MSCFTLCCRYYMHLQCAERTFSYRDRELISKGSLVCSQRSWVREKIWRKPLSIMHQIETKPELCVFTWAIFDFYTFCNVFSALATALTRDLHFWLSVLTRLSTLKWLCQMFASFPSLKGSFSVHIDTRGILFLGHIKWDMTKKCYISRKAVVAKPLAWARWPSRPWVRAFHLHEEAWLSCQNNSGIVVAASTRHNYTIT